MAAYRAIPRTFARIHRRHLTPSVSTIAMGLAAIAFYVLLTIVSGNVLADSIAPLGVLIAFYYGLTGFACAWHYRHELTHSARSLFLRGVIPLLGALLLFAALVKSLEDMWAADYGATFWTTPTLHWQIGGVFLLALGSLLLGVVLMVIYAGLRPAYFRGELLNRSTPVVAVPERGRWRRGRSCCPTRRRASTWSCHPMRTARSSLGRRPIRSATRTRGHRAPGTRGLTSDEGGRPHPSRTVTISRSSAT
jgi:hypothetical protein